LAWMTNSIIRYNTFYDCTQLCYISDSVGNNTYVDGLQIYGNVFYNDKYDAAGGTTEGVFIDGRGTRYSRVNNVEIFNNTFGDLGLASVWVFDEAIDGVKVYNNIFWSDSIDFTAGAANISSDYNLWYTAEAPAYEGAHSLTDTDPCFTNYSAHSAWDLTLKAASHAIDVGDPTLNGDVTLPASFVDIAGTSRPQGDRYDIGAYERASGAPANNAPVLTAIGAKTVAYRNALTFTITATDADPGDTLTYSTGELPSGSTFNPATQAFAWTPTQTQVGSSVVRFIVDDGSVSDYEDVTITVSTRYLVGKM
jgi:hypothetical protein